MIYGDLNVPISELSSVMIGVIVIVIGGRYLLGAHSTFTLGNFIAFLFAVFSMFHPVKNLTKAYNSIKRATVSLDRISVIMNRESEIVDARDALPKSSFDRDIVFRDVCFSYDGDRPVLDRVSLEIGKGEKIGLVGSSGSGKTTLVNLLNRMYDVTSGEILIDGLPVGRIRLHDLRRLYGTVTQESILFSDTVANNISYGSIDDVGIDRVREAARIACAREFIDRFPEGYNEMLQTKGSNLSGGQRQRLSIARAVVGDPPILIFDEATSALDSDSERKVQMAIEEATKNRTVIVIAHRLSTILSCDRIVVMEEGRILDIGKHDYLLGNCPRYRELYDIQFNTSGA